MLDTPDRPALLALLDFYVEAGVDLALDEEPCDRLAEAAPAIESRQERQIEAPSPRLDRPESRQPLPQRTVAKAPSVSPEDAAHSAREQAKHARSLAELEGLLAGF